MVAGGSGGRRDPLRHRVTSGLFATGVSQEPFVSQDRYRAEISSTAVLDASDGNEVSAYGWFVRRLARMPPGGTTSPNLLNGRPAPLSRQGKSNE